MRVSRPYTLVPDPKWGRRALAWAGAFAAIHALDLVVTSVLIEYVQRIILLSGINIILAVSLNLINGTTGQFSIGHAGFMAVGAYASAFLGVQLAPIIAQALGAGPVSDALTFNIVLIVGAVCAGATGLLVGIPSLRLKGDYLAVVTLGYGEIIRILFNNSEALGAATGYFGNSPSGLPAYTNFTWVFAWALVIIAATWNLTFSQTGRSLSAVREDEIAAEAIGTPTTRLKVTAFALSAAMAGIAGGLFAHMQAGVRPEDFRFEKSIDMIVMIIVGGLGSISGAVLGGVFVAVSLELMRDLQQYRLVLYALLLIVIMLVRPEGILGAREINELWPFGRATRGKVGPS
jgi:branched-chain amino acid transport system permease protein